ncbi:MAG TPA: chemotaxis protein CheB [Verrucomicrobiae bacterium]|nr:chemotaxis protein CheB [Verrucomicrobiae bacterium]
MVGVSAGGVDLLMDLLPALPADFPVPIAVVLHSGPGTTTELAFMLDRAGEITVREAEDKAPLERGRVYLAPGGYHLLVERDLTCSLSVDPPVRFARPAVDVLFDSAAAAFRDRVLAVVLSGASDDGANGARSIKEAGGMVIVQDPATAAATDMPRAAIERAAPDDIFTPAELPALLLRLCAPEPRP